MMSSGISLHAGEFTSSHMLNVESDALVETFEDGVIDAIRLVGIVHGYKISLRKVVYSDANSPAILEKDLFQDGDTHWAAQRLAKSVDVQVSLPRRLQYLVEFVRRYFGVGGDDQYTIFSRDGEVEEFLASLSQDDRNSLVKVYKKILKKRDHEWIMDWFEREIVDREGKSSGEMDLLKTCWFLSVLDRLCEGGLLDGTKIKYASLVDWDRIG